MDGSTETTQGRGVIRLRRRQGFYRDALGRYRVRIDGNHRRQDRCRRDEGLSVPPGEHRIRLTMDRLWTSREVMLQIRAGELAEFTWRPSASGASSAGFTLVVYQRPPDRARRPGRCRLKLSCRLRSRRLETGPGRRQTCDPCLETSATGGSHPGRRGPSRARRRTSRAHIITASRGADSRYLRTAALRRAAVTSASRLSASASHRRPADRGISRDTMASACHRCAASPPPTFTRARAPKPP